MKVSIILTLFALVCASKNYQLISGSFPRVRIFNPQENNVWFAGEKRTIVWRLAYVPPPPDPPTLNITLRRYNDSTFRLPIVSNFDTHAQAYEWDIPADLESFNDYQIRIIPNRGSSGHPNTMGSKSKPFSIIQKTQDGCLELISPTNTSVWKSGEFREIQWKFVNATSDATVSIYIEEDKFGYTGQYPWTIVKDLPYFADNGVSSYPWRVPYRFRTSKDYKITIVGNYNDGSSTPVVYSQKDGFEIFQTGDASHGNITLVLPQPTATA